MEMGFLRGEKIHLRDHKLGIWIVDILMHNNNVAYTLALRDDEAERVCLL
jgi:Fe2+ transport system protein FeoA